MAYSSSKHLDDENDRSSTKFFRASQFARWAAAVIAVGINTRTRVGNVFDATTTCAARQTGSRQVSRWGRATCVPETQQIGHPGEGGFEVVGALNRRTGAGEAAGFGGREQDEVGGEQHGDDGNEAEILVGRGVAHDRLSLQICEALGPPPGGIAPQVQKLQEK